MQTVKFEDVYIKYHNDDNPRLELTEDGAWCDLYVAKDITLYAQDYALIPLGVSIKLPQGYEAIIAPRSSTFGRYGILQTNGIGIIDPTYCGDTDEWKMPVYATRYTEIPKGARICQFRIQKTQPQLVFISVDSLGEKARNGFGSTGV